MFGCRYLLFFFPMVGTVYQLISIPSVTNRLNRHFRTATSNLSLKNMNNEQVQQYPDETSTHHINPVMDLVPSSYVTCSRGPCVRHHRAVARVVRRAEDDVSRRGPLSVAALALGALAVDASLRRSARYAPAGPVIWPPKLFKETLRKEPPGKSGNSRDEVRTKEVWSCLVHGVKEWPDFRHVRPPQTLTLFITLQKRSAHIQRRMLATEACQRRDLGDRASDCILHGILVAWDKNLKRRRTVDTF